MANAVMGWPIDTLPVSLAREVMQGALEVCNAAGVPLAGGHTIDSPEPMFGLSVTGLVESTNLKTNAGAKAGDVLLITKPLGLGMLSAAHKRGLTSSEQDEILYKWIVQTNHVGSVLGGISGVHAMTDVTGFGLAGHLLELCKSSGLGSVIESNKLPRIAEAETFASQFILPDNAMRNWNAYEGEIDMRDAGAFAWLVDPQSSGGLLLSVGAASLGEVEAALRAAQCFHQTIGEMVDPASLPDGKLLSVI
jgi:selenide,water dikinase